MFKNLLFLFSISLMSLHAEIDTYKEGEILYSQKGCNGCHGVHGEGMHEYPVIMNKPKWYLVKKMKYSARNRFIFELMGKFSYPFVYYLLTKTKHPLRLLKRIY